MTYNPPPSGSAGLVIDEQPMFAGDEIAALQKRVADVWSSAVPQPLFDAPHVTAEATELARAVQLILGELRKRVPFDSASVQQLRGSRLVIVAGVGFADLDVVLGESFDIDNADSPNGEVIHRRRPLLVRDTEQYRAFRRGLHVGAGIRSWLGAPLMKGEKLVGMIGLDKAEADFYTAEHQQAVLGFAGLLADVVTR
jgi:GAF domain-containing protein